MLDDMFDHMAALRDQPVWRAPSPKARAALDEPLPQSGAALAEVHDSFLRNILPYGSGNAHPGFMGWVQGGGTAPGMLADMLAAGLNANCGGRNHMAIAVERQVTAWTAQMFRFPEGSSGVFVTGASAANAMGVQLARVRTLGPLIRDEGLVEGGARLVAYAATSAHDCVGRAIELAGIGRRHLRLVPVDSDHRLSVVALCSQLAKDRAEGLQPFLIVGTAGTVDVGAIDPLDQLADVAAAEDLHFHVDGALGGLGAMSPRVAPRLKGLERADSIALDWHKWGQAPYDAGFFLARDSALHKAAFATDAAYLRRVERGLAGGDFWPCDYGPDLSRGFRALKVWFTLKHFGAKALARVVDNSLDLAARLGQHVAQSRELELLAPVTLNIVCFGWRVGDDCDAINAAIVEDLHEDGQVAPSLTRINGRTAIRAAIVNHRTTEADVDLLVDRVLTHGRRRHGAP